MKRLLILACIGLLATGCDTMDEASSGRALCHSLAEKAKTKADTLVVRDAHANGWSCGTYLDSDAKYGR